ncbi:MAG: zinc ribbon domain-containing protein [Lachnospiraceae bacterium]|nr:zinc ribbon domain-containing protein [Lachnospiraceae bacterium]
MKCPNCGANISIRDEYCAWCGKVNEHSLRHIQILKRYQAATEATKNDLEKQTDVRVPIFMRLLVIALLIIGVVVCFVLMDTSWDRKYNRREAEAIKNAPVHTAELDRLLAAHDHTGFSRYMGSHYISVYGHVGNDRYPYKKYKQYVNVNDYYIYTISHIMDLYPYRSDSYDSEESTLEEAAQYINYFYDAYARAQKDEDLAQNSVVAEAIEDMELQMQAMTVRYLGVDRADAAGLKELTEAQRRYLIEESYRMLKAGGVS